jgi:hypothetical protein
MTQAFGHKLDRWILKKGFRVEQPLSSLRLIETRRVVADPLGYLQSRRKAREVVDGSSWATFIPREAGYKLFGPDAFPELPRVVQACLAVYRKHKAELTADKAVNKRYFYNILTVDDLREHPVLLDFPLSRSVTQAATGYLGQVPRLHSLGVFFSEINDTTDGSQLFHVDGDALAQIKCFVNAWEVGPGSGPLTFVPKRNVSNAMRNSGLLKTISDADVSRTVPGDAYVAVTGPAGSGVFVDTSRCLHQGSRSRERPRLVFQFQYVTRPDALLTRPPGKVVPGGHLHVTRDLAGGFRLANPDAMMFVG